LKAYLRSPLRKFGAINEERTGVGQVHLGLVFAGQLRNAECLDSGEELAGHRWLGRDNDSAPALEAGLALTLLTGTHDYAVTEAIPWL
jgi:hypothetical protein